MRAFFERLVRASGLAALRGLSVLTQRLRMSGSLVQQSHSPRWSCSLDPTQRLGAGISIELSCWRLAAGQVLFAFKLLRSTEVPMVVHSSAFDLRLRSGVSVCHHRVLLPLPCPELFF